MLPDLDLPALSADALLSLATYLDQLAQRLRRDAEHLDYKDLETARRRELRAAAKKGFVKLGELVAHLAAVVDLHPKSVTRSRNAGR